MIDDLRLRLGIADFGRQFQINNRHSQSSIRNLNRQSAIQKSEVANRQSAIS
jgi:hypothetical protein